MIISSQRHIDDAIVANKLSNRDLEVLVSPLFEFGGYSVRVCLDGHHSLEAARQAGVEPEYVEATERDDDRVGLISVGDYETFLHACHMDSDYYDVETGHDVW